MTPRRSPMRRRESAPSAGSDSCAQCPIQLCTRWPLPPITLARQNRSLLLGVAWTQHSRDRERLETVNKLEKKEGEGGRERQKSCTYKPELAGSQWPAYSSGEPLRTCCSPAAANHWNGQRERRKRRSQSLQLGRFLEERS